MIRRQMTTREKRLVLAMRQFDLPVQAGDLALAELVDLAVELEREALCVRDVAQNPVERVARPANRSMTMNCLVAGSFAELVNKNERAES